MTLERRLASVGDGLESPDGPKQRVSIRSCQTILEGRIGSRGLSCTSVALGPFGSRVFCARGGQPFAIALFFVDALTHKQTKTRTQTQTRTTTQTSTHITVWPADRIIHSITLQRGITGDNLDRIIFAYITCWTLPGMNTVTAFRAG